MIFALNPSTTQPFSTFYQNALRTHSGSSNGISTGAKVGAAIGSVAGAALILAGLFYLYRRYKKNKAVAATGPENGSYYDSAMKGSGPEEWLSETRPKVPPKQVELHGQSTLGELDSRKDPVELHHGNVSGTHIDPAEMWSPTQTSPSSIPPGYRSNDDIVSPGER